MGQAKNSAGWPFLMPSELLIRPFNEQLLLSHASEFLNSSEICMSRRGTELQDCCYTHDPWIRQMHVLMYACLASHRGRREDERLLQPCPPQRKWGAQQEQ